MSRVLKTLLLSLPLALAAASASAGEKPVLSMTATAVNMSGVGRAGATTLTIVIERWSTDDERAKLVDTLVEKGADKLLDTLDDIKPRAGFIRTNRSLGWDIQYARMQDLPGGGKRIIFATDRPMSFYEVRNNNRSTDYEFMLCEIRLNAEGTKGEGKLATAAKISYDKAEKRVEVENYGQQPVRLTSVTVDK